MPASESYGESDDEALLKAATQHEHCVHNDFEVSPRIVKRQRVEGLFEVHEVDDDFTERDLPNESKLNGEKGSGENSDIEAAKPKYLLHAPRISANLDRVILTQTQVVPHSQPYMIRGPIWRRPVTPDARENTLANFVLSKVGNDALRVPATLNDDSLFIPSQLEAGSFPNVLKIRDAPNYDPIQELVDLPSDAFSSSSSEIREQNALTLAAPLNGLRQTTLFGRQGAPVPASQSNKRHNWPLASREEPPPHHQIDLDAMKTWVYPVNIGNIRNYQFNIVHRGLFHNLLVALPTGLGKTFIAATIILNWYRWTKDAQIVFVAPTKPLVAQQVEACFNIAGIPRSQTTMLTGDVQTGLRAEEWTKKRVFFMTPQTLVNDLKTGICDPKRIVLLVIDEAHRATGGYAYVEVVKFVRRFNENFRILALTATPGNSVESVQKVVDGLNISRCEIRTELSIDIREYVHHKDISKQVFDPTEEMELISGFWTKAVQPVLNVVTSQNALWLTDPLKLTAFGCHQAKNKYMSSDAGRHANQGVKWMVMNALDALASIAHSLELLKYYSVKGFHTNLLKFRAETRTVVKGKKKSKYRVMIDDSEHFERLLARLSAWTNDPDYLGHPKLEQVRAEVLQHFVEAGEGVNGHRTSTRIEIFSHFRESVEEITELLRKDSPIIRPHAFVGQANGTNSEGMSQKKQLEVTQKFKNGDYNVLVATSVGEEGLDIGEVDLIICYDSKSSPIRLLQRMGRTGRKREGRVVWLQMRGKEQTDAEKAIDNYEKMQELIAKGDQFTFHHDRSRRMVPREMQPVVDKRIVEIPIENTQRSPSDFLPVPSKKECGRVPKRPPKKFHMPDGVRTGFVAAGRLEGEDSDADGDPLGTSQRIPLLEEVYLNLEDVAELEHRYQSFTGDDDDAVVGRPQLNKHPRLQRRLRRTNVVPHGHRTEIFVDTMCNLASIDNFLVQKQRTGFFESYLEPEDVGKTLVRETTLRPAKAKKKTAAKPANQPTTASKGPSRSKSEQIKPKATTAPRLAKRQARVDLSDMEAAPSSAPLSSPGMAMRSQAITLGSADTSASEDGEPNAYIDSDLEDFVVDDADPLSEESLESSLPSPSTLLTGPQTSVHENRQHLVESSQELPDLGSLLAPTIQGQRAGEDRSKAAGQTSRPKKRRRRIVSEGEDEDDQLNE